MVLSGVTLYGTASVGGDLGEFNPVQGTVFSLNTNGGSFKVLHTFTGGNDGGYPVAGLILSDNILYGTASEGANVNYYLTNYFGTVFLPENRWHA